MIPSPLLVVTDRHGSMRPLADTIRAVLDGGARWIWFRDKDLEPAARRDLAAELLDLVRDRGGRLTIGGDAALAAAVDADGVHLGGSAQAADIVKARQSLGKSHLIGLSAHGLEDVSRAADAGVDYVTLSPIFATPSKPGYGPPLGLDALGAATRCGVPVIALGGIEPTAARACLEAGAQGVAVMGRLMRAADPAEEVRCLLQAMQSEA